VNPLPPRAVTRPQGTRACRHRLRPAILLLTGVALLAPHAAFGQESQDPDPPADEQDEAPEGGRIRLTVTHLTPVLGPGSSQRQEHPEAIEPSAAPSGLDLRVLVENTGAVPLDALRLVVEVHPAVAGRDELHRVLAGELRSVPEHVHDLPVDEGGRLEPGILVGMTDRFPTREISWADGAGGVHPLRIAVVRGTEVLAEAVTAVVWLHRVPAEPLHATLIWPLDAPPWRTVEGAYASTVDREIRLGGRLDVLIRALERRRDVPVVLAPSAHVLEDLGDRSDGFTVLERQDGGGVEARELPPDSPAARESTTTLRRIRELAAVLPHPPVSSSYADADLAAMFSAGGLLRELAAEVVVDGRRRLQRQLGTEVDAGTFLLTQHVTTPILDLLPGDTLLVPHRVTAGSGVGGPLPAAVRSVRTPSGRLVDAILADPYLEEVLADPTHPAGPLLVSQRILATTAMAFLEAPAASDRTLLLLPPPTWDPSPAAAEAMLEGLASASWLRLTSPGEQAAVGRASRAPLELAPPPDGPFSSELTTGLAAATLQLDALVAALPEGVTRIEDRTPTELRDELLRAASAWYRGPGEPEALSLIRDVQRTIDTAFGEVEVGSGSVTLTSDTGSIPVTLQRGEGGPITVAIEVTSQGRLLWPEGRRSEPFLLDEGASQTVSFATRALSTGTFPVTVRVTDPTGAHELHRTTISVRSTALSGPALAATGVLVLVLLLAGALRRRTRAPHLEVVN
jgi:hypothetical protein